MQDADRILRSMVNKNGGQLVLRYANASNQKARKIARILLAMDGGKGSGNFGHKGRPGKRGGSGPGGGKHYRGANRRISASDLTAMLHASEGSRSHAIETAEDLPSQGRLFDKVTSLVSSVSGRDAREAIGSYSFRGDVMMNGMLRGNKPRSHEQQREWRREKETTRKHIEQLTDAIAETRLPQDAIVYRGVETVDGLVKALGLNMDSETMERMLGNPGFVESLMGYTFCDPGFTSSTIDKRVIYDGGFAEACEMEIFCPKGTQGIYLGHDSQIASEQEYLMQRGTQFVITGASVFNTYDGKKRLQLQVTVIAQEPQEIPELQSAFRDANQRVLRMALSDQPVTSEMLRAEFPNASDQLLNAVALCHNGGKPDDFDIENAIEADLFFGRIDPLSATELMSVSEKSDQTGWADRYTSRLQRMRADEEEFKGEQYAKEREEFKNLYPDCPPELVPFLTSVQHFQNDVQQDLDAWMQEKNPSAYRIGRLRNQVERFRNRIRQFIDQAKEG